jgi:hypothetical protein
MEQLHQSFTIINGKPTYDIMSPNETTVYYYLKRHFDTVVFNPTIIYEKRLYRPSFALYFNKYPMLTIIVEVDEEYNWRKQPRLEALRMHNMIHAVNKDWTYIIRFNPSVYVMEEGELNPLCIEARLKQLYNKVKQILVTSVHHSHRRTPMDQRVTYLFYPEHRSNLIALEMFWIDE